MCFFRTSQGLILCVDVMTTVSIETINTSGLIPDSQFQHIVFASNPDILVSFDIVSLFTMVPALNLHL